MAGALIVVALGRRRGAWHLEHEWRFRIDQDARPRDGPDDQ